jgi:hypothetical protein
MRTTVAQGNSKRGKIDPVRNEIQSLDARDWRPKIGINAPGINPGVYGSKTRNLTIDAHFDFAKRGSAILVELLGQIIRNIGVPELVLILALGENV